MPRQARLKSESGIYHLIMRGTNRQTIFFDDEDSKQFLLTLQKYKEICGYHIFAYCLMQNHFHLLLKVGEEPLEQILRRVCGSFVFWFNKKYDRIGNLFQDRFKSEPIEDDAYFLTALRYIHNNPIKAGLVKQPKNYPWSSYVLYTMKPSDNKGFLDLNFVLKMFGSNRIKALSEFVAYHQQFNEDMCLDMVEHDRINDKKAIELIKLIAKIKNIEELQVLEKQKRALILQKLKKDCHLSIRQIERLTGIHRSVVHRA